MKSLVIYDSAYGNTAKVAQTILTELTAAGSAELRLVADVQANDLTGLDLLVVGSPTQGGKPTPALQTWLTRSPADSLNGVRVAAFDTRYAIDTHGRFLKLVMQMVGFAAPRISTALKAKGGHSVAEPVGFIVGGKEGPLAPSELVRATAWAQQLINT